MVRAAKRGATRKAVKPVRQARQPISWSTVFNQGFVVVSLLAIVALVYFLQRSDTFPILHVSVGGEVNHVDRKALIKAVSPYAAGSFLHVNVSEIQRAGQNLPWIKQIQVRRIWPDTLHLIVEEQKPVAYWKKDGLINSDGHVFYVQTDSMPKGLPRLDGPDKNAALLTQRFYKMNKKLRKNNFKIRLLKMDDRRAWTVQLSTGTEILLGRANSEQRFERFLNVFLHDLQQYQSSIAVMDMRYTNGLAVKWKAGLKPDFNGTV